MSDIKTRRFKCTGCGEDRPCYLETNRESSIMDVYTEDTLKCVMDETNRTGYNWEEVQANGVTTGTEQCNLPVVVCSNCPKVIGLTVGKSYTQLAKHKDIIALVNDYGDLKRYNIAYFE